MKVLVVGMDGAHLDAFKRGWTPFTESLIKSKKQLNIKNDLLSRGWLEIATGSHAKNTKAMYDMPNANGTLNWTTKFSINDIPDYGTSVKPIWQVLNDRGYSVGIMNVPTTFPAPEVNGFFVSGGGGGAPVAEKVSESLCFPKDITKQLRNDGYIVDDRMYQLVVDKKLTTPSDIFERLAFKNKKRTESFIKLDREYKVDFGFIVYKTSSVLAETILHTEWTRRKNLNNSPDYQLEEAIKKYYENFDREIFHLSKSFPECEIVFVSDHGTFERNFSVNPNIFLQSIGYQKSEARKSFVKNLVRELKEVIPFTIKAYLKKTSVMKAKNIGQTSFNSAHTVAFCKTQGDWSHGIYINDSERFGGPVSQEDIPGFVDDIVNAFNVNPEATEHGLYAYSSWDKDNSKPNHFPDIVIDVPNGYLTIDSCSEFIGEFSPPKIKSSLASIMKGDILALKSHSPIAIASFSQVEAKDYSVDQGDLTAVYELILAQFD